MSFIRTLTIALAVMLPVAWTVAHAAEGDSSSETKTTMKTKKS